MLTAKYNAVDDYRGMVCYCYNDGNIKSIKIDGNTVQFDPEINHNNNFEINTANTVIDWDEWTATCPDEYLINGKIKSWTIKPKDSSIVLTQEDFDNEDIVLGYVYKEDYDDTKYIDYTSIYTDEEWDFDVASNSLSLCETAINYNSWSYYNCNFVLLKYNYDTEQHEMIDTVNEVEYITGGIPMYDYAFETEGYHEVEFILKENYIWHNAFEECISLAEVTIPNSVTSIEDWTFYSCSSLTSVTIGNSVTSIRGYAFYNCTSLAEVICNAITAPTIDSYTFCNVKTDGVLKVPANSDYSSWMRKNAYYLGYYNWTTEFDMSIDMSIDMSNYLTIEALEDGLTASLSTKACEYCVDGDGKWKTLAAGTATESINTGQTLSFRGNITPTSLGIGTFTISKKCNLKGNCMSMLFEDDAANNYSLSNKTFAFQKLFDNCTNIVNVSDNFLPATTLSDYCYSSMFNGCTSLKTAPILPATTLAPLCYNYMFRGCTSLTTAPNLPATTLSDYCYSSMFNGCTSLVNAPTLPAKTLKEYCYYNMFNGCTSLTTAPALSATTLANNCCWSMFEGCTNLTTAPELPAITLANGCYYNMFRGCSSLTTAPTLPATSLVDSCYYGLFNNCSSLTTAPELPVTTLASSCYAMMFSGCTSLTTAPELPAKTLAQSCYANMFSNTSLNYIKMLATNISASNCLYNWVKGVASSGTFVKKSAMTSLPTGNSGIPSGWTVVNAA